MPRHCDICLNTALEAPRRAHCRSARTRLVLIEDRIFALCERHAVAVRTRGIDTVEELRACFREGEGKRSLVNRRAALDRRIFPARPEGRRMNSGRRANDRPF